MRLDAIVLFVVAYFTMPDTAAGWDSTRGHIALALLVLSVLCWIIGGHKPQRT